MAGNGSVIPDVYLGLVALFLWRRGWLATLAATAGAVVGGALMFGLAAANPQPLAEFLLRVPGLSAPMAQSVAEQFERSGLLALVLGPLQGIPYKVFAVQAGSLQHSLLLFVLLTIPARLERLQPVAIGAGLLGAWLKPWLERRTGWMLVLYVVFWIVVYAIYYATLARAT